MFFAPHTHPTRADRRRRKRLGQWNADFATQAWVTKEGKKIKVRDMGDDHLTNTIRLLYRKAASAKMRDDTVFLVDYPQGDMAKMAFDEAADEQFGRDSDEYVPDIYWAMVEEYEFRGFSREGLEDYKQKVELGRFSQCLKLVRNG